MLRVIDSAKMGRGQHDWLDSHFHFSFAEYFNPQNIRFGVLRVVNDDLVQPGTGFDAHPHKNMEIISYVVDGALTHQDSMGNEHTLTRGQSQYMSAGTGVLHSEYNHGKEILRFLQIWILPDAPDYPPNYGDHRFVWEDRVSKWLPIATWYENTASTAPIKVHADVNVYVAAVPAGEAIELTIAPGRQAYLVLIEGSVAVKDLCLKMRDALEITEEKIDIQVSGDAHLLVIEMRKSTL